jgi:amidophosphoribosyltransferase
MYRAVGEAGRDAKSPQYCDACFTGQYPIEIVDGDDANSCNTLKQAKLA